MRLPAHRSLLPVEGDTSMQVFFQPGFLVALLVLAGSVALIVLVVNGMDDPLGDEMAHCVRQSAELLDTCAHAIDGRPLDEAALGDFSDGRWPTPAHSLHLTHPATAPGAAMRT